MKVSNRALAQWIEVNQSVDELAKTLTMLGHEVDEITPIQASFTEVVIGHIIEKTKHPDADKLNICQVDVGMEECLQIVCGAKNVAQGQKVAVALVGAVLPGDFKIKKAKLRGETSSGMICAASELGIDFPHDDGIWVLSDDAPIGHALSEYLKLDDTFYDLALTPNRADCFSVKGLARDLCAKSDSEFPFDESDNDAVSKASSITITTNPKHVGTTVFTEVALSKNAQTPSYVALALHRLGYQLLHPLVDAIHLIMHELGQPMHAYDADKIGQSITIEDNLKGDFIALDGHKYTLNQEDLVVTDGSEILALAGVIGGESTKVESTTERAVIETAYFQPEVIAKTARRHKVSTGSSMRFERGVDPELAVNAVTHLLEKLKEWGIIEDDVSQSIHTVPTLTHEITFEHAEVQRVLGFSPAPERCESILNSLGCAHQKLGTGELHIKTPSWRFDLSLPIDIIEEIARIEGYEKATIKPITPQEVKISPNTAMQLSHELIALGFHEITTCALTGPEDHVKDIPITLLNPIANPLSTMRTSLLPGLLRVAEYNYARNTKDIRIFEKGAIYLRDKSGYQEIPMLAGLVHGARHPLSWQNESEDFDFYDLKGMIIHSLSVLGLSGKLDFSASSHWMMHPGQSATMHLEGRPIGSIGKLHPNFVKSKKSPRHCYFFEILLNELDDLPLIELSNVSQYPGIQRDLCFWVDHAVPFDSIREVIYKSSTALLKDAVLFDIYRSSEDERVSYTIRLSYESSESTLSDSDIDHELDSILVELKKKYNIKMR